VKEGKVRFIGASNYGPERLAESLETSRQKGFPRYESLQPHYNLYERFEYENKMEPLCRKQNLGVIPYFSLAAGFLTGKYRSEADASKSLRGPGIVKKYLNERGLRILKALDETAQNYRSKPGSIALAWLLSRPSVTAPIVSATTLEQWDDLVESTRLKLDPAAIRRLDEASAEETIPA